LIGVGGISDFNDIKDFWRDGGKVVQLYTAYVYQGPDVLKNLNRQMLELLDKNQLNNLSDFFKLELKERQKMLL
jgi:dihydroorotate dehydrogenase